jgi:hypothetical protein
VLAVACRGAVSPVIDDRRELFGAPRMRLLPAAITTLLLVASSAGAALSEPRHLVARSGLTLADLSYWTRPDTTTHAPRIRIVRGRTQLLAERIPMHPRGQRFGYPVHASDEAGWFAVRDLDGYREPEVLVVVYWGGAYCCAWSRVYRLVGQRYLPSLHWWGNVDAVPRLRDLNADGRPEFVSKDGCFQVLTAYVAAFYPIQLWAYEQGKFRDVTRSYPRRIADARRHWRYYVSHRRNRTVRYVLAAWAADQYMLGRGAVAERGLQQALKRGDLDRDIGGPRDPAAFLRSLKRFLRSTGYLRG